MVAPYLVTHSRLSVDGALADHGHPPQVGDVVRGVVSSEAPGEEDHLAVAVHAVVELDVAPVSGQPGPHVGSLRRGEGGLAPVVRHAGIVRGARWTSSTPFVPKIAVCVSPNSCSFSRLSIVPAIIRLSCLTPHSIILILVRKFVSIRICHG